MVAVPVGAADALIDCPGTFRLNRRSGAGPGGVEERVAEVGAVVLDGVAYAVGGGEACCAERGDRVPGLTWPSSRPPRALALLGAFAGAVGTATTGLAPALALALAGQLLAGAGNAIYVVASDVLVQRVVPRELLGRVFGLIGTCAQLGAALAYSAGGPLLAATSPRTVYLIAGAGSLAALPLLAPALRAARP